MERFRVTWEGVTGDDHQAMRRRGTGDHDHEDRLAGRSGIAAASGTTAGRGTGRPSPRDLQRRYFFWAQDWLERAVMVSPSLKVKAPRAFSFLLFGHLALMKLCFLPL